MPYRPQFAFPVPAGYNAQDFDHYYDNLNTAALNIPPGGAPVTDIPLNIDPDAIFRWRGIKIPNAGGLRDLQVRFRDCSGRYLQDDYVPAWATFVPPTSDGLNGGQSIVIEPEIECPAGGTVLLDVIYPTPSSALASGAVAIAGDLNGGGLGSYSGVTFGAIQRNSALYQVVTTVNPNGTMGVYKSVNNGLTWTELDSANHILFNNGAVYWGGGQFVTVLYRTGSGGSPCEMKTFDLDIEGWGAAFAQTSAPTTNPEALWQKSNGDYFGVFRNDSTAGNPLSTSLFTAGAWTTPLIITANAAALPAYNSGNTAFLIPTTILDSSDRLHVIFSTSSHQAGTPLWNGRFFYQQVSPANTLPGTSGTFLDFPNQSTAPQDLFQVGSGATGRLQIVGDRLIWGIIRNDNTGTLQQFPALYIGTGLAAPVWAETASIDPNQTSFLNRPTLDFPSVFFDPIQGRIYAVWTRSTPASATGQVQMAFTRDSAFVTNWVSQTIYESATSDAPGETLFYPLIVIGPNGSIIGLSLDVTKSLEPGNEARSYVTYPTLEIILTGVKLYPGEQR